ncbi:hypothetical protein BDF20DRAFT_858877 [Mycotypha africana]|uniref:uncharacterized protein n=1 Tax=Mycotypha africana TaxID=64632 RepID=UPI0023002DFC|nr:uncharacterized protein BDF20DRAFT_858877 [Mycotypha africana]KAI8984258.1 hypothetical protein BDF20DRAFT_858877 [Mycotypha africana]
MIVRLFIVPLMILFGCLFYYFYRFLKGSFVLASRSSSLYSIVRLAQAYCKKVRI